MKKIAIGIVLISVMLSCKDAKEIKATTTNEIVEKSTAKDAVKKSEVVSDEGFKEDFGILLPRSYRVYNEENPIASLTDKWVDLYQKNGTYYLGKPDFEIEKGFDECSGDSLVSINSKNKTILLMNYPGLKLGKIKFLKIDKNKVWPNEKMTHVFNNVSYTLRAEGKILSSEVHADGGKEEIFKEVENYKLYLTVENKEQLLLTEKSFNDTFVILLFAGDIDGDGKLDFIFGANRHYEEERVVLFLSSKAKNGEAVKKVSEVAIGFDC